tara:strand:- start:1880 stop:2674 length:795 start_codon:yes stop_codon:yes gene_type:complete
MHSKEEVLNKLKLKNENLTANLTDPKTGQIYKYSIVNETTLWRAQTLFTKEPITIEWIRSFKKNKIFFDVGANVGMYSIFASLNSHVAVYAFEPESNNFQTLMNNIDQNNLSDLITPYPIGLSDNTELSKLQISKFEAGSSHHTVGENLLDHENLEVISNNFSQGIFSTTIDDLCFKWNLPIPSYLKIDVDGIESKIIEESTKTLSSSDLESVLIEINENREQDTSIIKTLNKIGFSYDKDQVNKARRESGPHKGYAEYLFVKR